MTVQELAALLAAIDGKGYKAYKSISGIYRYPRFELFIDHVQSDPFAAMSRLRVRVSRQNSGFADDTTANPGRTTALEDFLTRRFHHHCQTTARGSRGIGQSGIVTIEKPAQEILKRSSMIVDDRFVEVRFFAGLPALGRNIAGLLAITMLCRDLPRIVDASLFIDQLDRQKLYDHLLVAEDANALRAALPALHLVAFIGNGTSLPRASGIDPRPLVREQSIPFESPPELALTIDVPNHGRITGMGIPRGVTLLVGGGYHGKSTLLSAMERGIYNHVPGDGREYLVTDLSAVKIRAADGRSIEKTDISAFINHLPFQKDTSAFCTDNASGSTSQAAGIAEAVEIGTTALLMDEDTSATNFMIRDARMQQLVSEQQEPITPFIDKVRWLFTEKGISTVLVMGSSGDYFSVADHVIQMETYRPRDVSARAKQIAAEYPSGRAEEGKQGFGTITPRIPLEKSFNRHNSAGRSKISARGCQELLFGQTLIDCQDLEQIVETAQMRAIGYAIDYARRYMDGYRTLAEVVQCVMNDLEIDGLDILSPFRRGDLARFRSFELAGTINRMRTLKVRQRL